MPAHQALAGDPTATAAGKAVPLADVGAAVGSAAAVAVATDVAVAEQAIGEVEAALAAGELTVEEAETVEQAVGDAAEVAIAEDVAAAGELEALVEESVAEEARDDA